jgi:transcriptional regulator with XRE-family HTH domain
MLDKELQINRLIGQNIRIQREAHGATPADLALHMGITSEQLQKIEIGESHVSAAHLKLICEHLDISPMALHPVIEYKLP